MLQAAVRRGKRGERFGSGQFWNASESRLSSGETHVTTESIMKKSTSKKKKPNDHFQLLATSRVTITKRYLTHGCHGHP
jgi:hypothetical protein